MNVGDSKTNLVWADLSGTKLIGADLSGADLWQANLSEADLREANLSGADLREADFSGADLQEANLSGADLQEPDFSRSTRSIDLSWKLQRANFSEKALWHISLTRSLQGADFSGADLREADLSEADLRVADFSEANLVELDPSGGVLKADLSEADLREADFSGSLLREVNFSGATLREANFSEANLIGADLSETDLREADFSEADLLEADLSEAHLRDTDLSGENLERAELSGAHLEGVDFSRTNLQGADLSEADLQEADLSKAYLEDVDFSKADLREADLSDEPVDDAPKKVPSDVNLFQSLPDIDLSWRLRPANLSEETLDFFDSIFSLSSEENIAYLKQGPNLLNADLSKADICNADFSKAMLQEADFSKADLNGTNISGANLEDAELSEANLNDADLSGANLEDAELSEANLNDADLSGANLKEADLSGTDLRGTTLDHAGLYETLLQNIKVNEGTSACPPSRWQLEADKSAEIGILGWPVFRRFRAFRRSASSSQVLNSAERQYRRIERLYRENDLRPNRALAVYEKHARRKRALAEGDLLGWLARAFSRWALGYGILIWPIVLVMSFVIVACALVYPIYGFEDGTLAKATTATGTVAYETLPPAPSLETARTLARSLYFSTITFSTLGYGDLFPTGGARALATVESFVGALSIAYLVSVLSRRVIR
jgi:uncharacterized protein YjbI with pentapeptide repeats